MWRAGGSNGLAVRTIFAEEATEDKASPDTILLGRQKNDI